ncbi:MAG: ABC transporter permease [Deltaproteobacteria bacterium]|nr:ABC transporter permease [Deltaproteobacteria bacterium]MBW2123253.1 ABC transporter permease [Deltaproteobacteria bacterium]
MADSGIPSAGSTPGPTELEELRKASLPSFYERHLKVQLYRLLLLFCLLALWQIVSGRLIPANWIASPVLVAQTAWEWISSGILLYHLSITFLEMLLGSLIGTALAIATGFLLSSSSLLSDALTPYISAVYGIPRIALAPLFVIWFGIGIASKVALVTVVVYFLVFFNAFVGARQVDQTYIDVLRVMGASKWDLFRKVVFPHAAGWIFTGLRFALPRALVAAVVGEIISSNRGLGYLLEESGGMFDVAGILVAVAVLALLGVALNFLVSRTEIMTSGYRFIE